MMKITREEKQLYKFLDCINKIFGKTDENDSSQMKIEAYVENNQESSEEPPEEFEDEEYDDPMA